MSVPGIPVFIERVSQPESGPLEAGITTNVLYCSIRLTLVEYHPSVPFHRWNKYLQEITKVWRTIHTIMFWGKFLVEIQVINDRVWCTFGLKTSYRYNIETRSRIHSWRTRTRRTISVAATMQATKATMRPAVTNGRPNNCL